MKFTINTSIFKDMVSIVNKIIMKEVGSNSFGNLYIEVKKNILYLKTNQFDFNIVYKSNINDSVEGFVIVPIQALLSVVESFIDTLTNVEFVEKKLIISTNTSTTDIFTITPEKNVNDFNSPNKNNGFFIKREIIVQGFKKVIHAAAESVIKPEISSVYLYTDNKTIYFVSTDTFRLAEARFMLEKNIDNVNIIIPVLTVGKIIKVLENISDTNVQIDVDNNILYIKTENIQIKTGIVSGNFPNYKEIIPKNFDVQITLLKSDIVNFLKKARFFSNNLNKLTIKKVDNKMIEMEFNNETVGSTKNIIPASITGDVKNIPSYNYKSINDAISSIADDRIILSLTNNQANPLMIRGVEESSLTAIIAPLIND